MDWHTTITKYFDDLLSKDLQIDAFCSGYEEWWNFRRPNENEMTDREKDALKSVFDAAIYFTPFEDELKQLPIFTSEAEVRETVRKALTELRSVPS